RARRAARAGASARGAHASARARPRSLVFRSPLERPRFQADGHQYPLQRGSPHPAEGGGPERAVRCPRPLTAVLEGARRARLQDPTRAEAARQRRKIPTEARRARPLAALHSRAPEERHARTGRGVVSGRALSGSAPANPGPARTAWAPLAPVPREA